LRVGKADDICRLKQLQETHNVRLFFPPESAEQSSILLVYDPNSPKASPNPVEKSKSLKEVKAEVEKIAKEAGNVKTELVTVEPKWHDTILGANGTTLNALIGEEKTISIKLGKDAGQEDRVDVVLVRGQSSEVDRAVKDIAKMVEDAKNDQIASSYVSYSSLSMSNSTTDHSCSRPNSTLIINSSLASSGRVAPASINFANNWVSRSTLMSWTTRTRIRRLRRSPDPRPTSRLSAGRRTRRRRRSAF
jgi:hypothetical protein